MYTYLASQWITNNCFTHLISILACDKELIDTFSWLGFGYAVVDTLRDVNDIHVPMADVKIRRATRNDLDVIVSLDHELSSYLEGPPIFMTTLRRGREYHNKWLSKSQHGLWLALYKEQVVAFMKICPINEDYLITDEKTIWIQGAYTKTHLRRKGIGTALLKQALAWARSEGYTKCAVDFETDNVLASAFWLRYFKPTCFTLVRYININS